MHLLQFVNYFASIIYAAFLKGMSVRCPGGYDHLFGSRHEEDYEGGSDALNEAMKHAQRVEPARTSLTSKIKAEEGGVGKCLQGDLLYICIQSSEKSSTPVPRDKLLSHKKALVKIKAYITYKTWMGHFYHKQSLFVFTHVRKHKDESTPMKVMSICVDKQNRSISKLLNFGKCLCENSGKLMILVLTIQVAAVQAFHNTTHVNLVSAVNATDSYSIIPMLAANQASFNMILNNTPNLSEIHQYVDIRKEVLQKILHQLDTIFNDLQEISNFLIKNKDTNSHPEESSNPTPMQRVVRSLPIEDSIMCAIEQDTLINLRNEVQVTLEQPNEGGSNNCQLNFDSDRCEELIKLVQCGYSHLRDGFIAARENMSEVVLTGLKFAEFEEKYMRLLDDKRKFHSQQYNQKINKLKTEVQELQNLLNTSISLMKEKRIKYCISEISSGKIESAMQEFQSLNDDSLLSKIIRSVYIEYGNLSQVDNIVNFMNRLPQCVQHNITYTVLFDEMHKMDHLSSPNVLIVAQAARRCMGETYMKSYVERALDTWANKVRTNKDDALIIDFGKKNWIAFRAYLPDLIDKAYENELTNVENIIFFVDKLYYLQDRAIGYLALFNKMRSNGHVNSYQTLILAYKVKECMDMYNYPNIEQHYRDMFNTLGSNLPNSVKGLVWSSGNGCTIHNVHYGDYLSIYKRQIANGAVNFAVIYIYYTYEYKIHTWHQVPSDKNDDFYWELDMLDEGKYFKIKNKRHDFFCIPLMINIVQKGVMYILEHVEIVMKLNGGLNRKVTIFRFGVPCMTITYMLTMKKSIMVDAWYLFGHHVPFQIQ